MNKQKAKAKFSKSELWEEIQGNKAHIRKIEEMIMNLTQDAQAAVGNLNEKVEKHTHNAMTGRVYFTDVVHDKPEEGLRGKNAKKEN